MKLFRKLFRRRNVLITFKGDSAQLGPPSVEVLAIVDALAKAARERGGNVQRVLGEDLAIYVTCRHNGVEQPECQDCKRNRMLGK